MKGLLLISAVCAAVQGQDEPRVGSDGRPLLNKPKLDLCKNRKFHEKYGKHHYFLSWREPWNKFEAIKIVSSWQDKFKCFKHFLISRNQNFQEPKKFNTFQIAQKLWKIFILTKIRPERSQPKKLVLWRLF